MTQGYFTTYFTASSGQKYLVLHWYYIGIVLQYLSPCILLLEEKKLVMFILDNNEQQISS